MPGVEYDGALINISDYLKECGNGLRTGIKFASIITKDPAGIPDVLPIALIQKP
jgi:hypothetical protein